jgi:membrane protease YdiL (CAAX protease family)
MLAAGLMIAWLSGMSLEVDPVRGILIIPLIAQNLTASPGEELLHRQWLYQKFKTKLGRPRALILQAVIFSAGHIQNWFFGEPVLFASYLSRFFGGVILGLAFDEAGLAAACVAHFLFNVELDVVLFGSSKRGWLATVVSLAVGGLIALAAHRWINRPRDGTSVTNHAEDTMPPTGPAAQPCPACRAA